MARRDRLKQGEEAKQRVMERLSGGGVTSSSPGPSRRIDRLKPPEAIADINLKESGIDNSVRAMAPELFNPQQNLDAFNKMVQPKETKPMFGPPVPNELGTTQRQNAAQSSPLTRFGEHAAELADKLIPGSFGNQPVKRPIEGLSKIPDIPGITTANPVTNFIRGAGDTASLGLSSYLDRMGGNVDAAEGATQTGAGRAGQIAGGFVLPAGRLKAGASLISNIGRGAGAGALLGAGIEAGEMATGRNNQSLGKRALDVGVSAGLGGAGVAAFAGLGKLAQSVINKYRKPVAAPGPTLGLPAPRQRGNLNTAGSDQAIAPEYTFKLPGASPATLNRMGNVKQTRDDLKVIDDEIRQLNSSYERAIVDEYNYLKQSLKERGGVQQGKIQVDDVGEVVGRTGRISNNPLWYQEFYAANGKVPSNKELYDLARQRVENGFKDEAGDIPSWKVQNGFDESMESLQSVRDTINQSLREIDPAINITNSPLKSEGLGFNPLPKSRSNINQEPPSVQSAPDVQNYAGNSIPFRQAAAQSNKTINRNQVVKNMRSNMGVVIDTGRLSGGRGVLGQYKVNPEVVRSRMAEDLQVISHEIGHHLDKKFKLTNDPVFHAELGAVARNNASLNIAAYQPNQIPGEGVAEYVRLRLTDPDKARQLAPQFSKYFDAALDKKTLKGLEASASDVDTWITQGDYNQAKGLIDFESGSKKTPFSWDKQYTKYLDDLNPLKLVEKALKGKLGIGNDSVYKMARLSRGVGEKAKLAVTRGVYDAQGNKTSDGLAQIVRPLEKLGVSERDFSTYLAVKHATDLKAMGKQVPFDDGQIRAVLSRLDTPEVQAVQQGVIKYNNALLDILVDAQILSQEAVDAMRQKYPNYVPFMRYFDDDAIAGFKNGGFGGAKGFVNVTNPIKKMTEEGSTRTIINPLESIIKNTMLVMNAAAKNKVGLQLADLSKVEGAGAWVEALGEGGASASEHVIAVHMNGARQSFKIRDPELYNAMLSLDAESSNSLIKFLGGAASILRAGAVLTPEFTIRNAFRDVLGATMNSTQYGFNPVDFAKGMFHVLGKTKTFDQFLSSGGAMSNLMSLDRDVNREAMQAVFRRTMNEKALNVITSPKELAKMLSGYTPAKTIVGGLRKAAEISELSTKVGSFNKTLKKTGSIEEAAYTARDLMDFNRAGNSIRQANRAVAFLNAALQGTDKMARAFKDNPASFMTRAFTTLVLPTIGLYYYNKTLPTDMKEEFDNIPQWQKDTFFIVGIPGVGFARLPKPFEAGMLFSTGTERMMKYFEDNDPEAFKDYGRSLLETFTPPVMLTALTPLLEGITNYSFFRKAPIVGMGDQRFEKKDQFSLYTSETAKGIGNILSHTPLKDSNFASPKIIDNTIKGYTAGLGQYAVSGIDAGINAIKGKSGPELPAKKLTEQPFARSFFVNTAGGGQVREDFYSKWDKISKKKASADRNELPFNDPDYNRLKAGKKSMDRLYKDYKEIQNDLKMSAVEKRARLDILDQQMNDVAEKSLRK